MQLWTQGDSVIVLSSLTSFTVLLLSHLWVSMLVCKWSGRIASFFHHWRDSTWAKYILWQQALTDSLPAHITPRYTVQDSASLHRLPTDLLASPWSCDLSCDYCVLWQGGYYMYVCNFACMHTESCTGIVIHGTLDFWLT